MGRLCPRSLAQRGQLLWDHRNKASPSSQAAGEKRDLLPSSPGSPLCVDCQSKPVSKAVHICFNTEVSIKLYETIKSGLRGANSSTNLI